MDTKNKDKKMKTTQGKNSIQTFMIKTENNEELWQIPNAMVGFYSETAIPIVSPSATEEALRQVKLKKVVCSPDLPITEYPTGEMPTPGATPVNQAQSIQCQICHKMYSSKSAYQAHQRTHVKDEDPYRCNICSKTFAVPARLTRHYRTHTGEKPFRCEFCNKSFSVKENLSVHRRIHTKERPYKCEVCARAFEHSGKLHRHMRIHTGERPHKCSVCSKTFIQSGQLVIHMRTHTGEKPYVCTVCQKGFTCSKQLKVHSRTHTGEKPYSCEICGKSFGYNHVLKLHQVAHYGEKVYKCTICNDTFNSKKSMEAHIKSHSDNAAPVAPPTPPASSASSDTSCSSSSSTTSDKENKDAVLPQKTSYEPDLSYESDIRYYLFNRDMALPQDYSMPSAGVELLAAAASVTEEYRNSDMVFNLITRKPEDMVVTLRHPAYFTAPVSPSSYPNLSAGDDIRRRVEAALAVDDLHSSEDEQPLTPPSESPVSSPTPPPASPDPELSLPPKKRSKMILKSKESSASIDLSPVRYSSVIHYARSS